MLHDSSTTLHYRTLLIHMSHYATLLLHMSHCVIRGVDMPRDSSINVALYNITHSHFTSRDITTWYVTLPWDGSFICHTWHMNVVSRLVQSYKTLVPYEMWCPVWLVVSGMIGGVSTNHTINLVWYEVYHTRCAVCIMRHVLSSMIDRMRCIIPDVLSAMTCGVWYDMWCLVWLIAWDVW